MKKVMVEVELKDGAEEDDLYEYINMFNGVEHTEELTNDPSEGNRDLEHVGSILWQARDRNNPGAIDECLEYISWVTEHDFSNEPITGRYEVLSPKSSSPVIPVGGSPDICVWTASDADDYELEAAFERMKGVERAETSL